MVDRLFVDFSVAKLTQLEQRIEVCLDMLPPDKIWWRGAEGQNSIGNLVLHLSGNVRQWILTGCAGHPDTRQRDLEFSSREELPAEALKAKLRESVEPALEYIRGLTPEQLTERMSVQGYNNSVLEAVYHVVEHFSMHTGQIMYATKLLTGSDLGFYKHLHQPKHGAVTP